MNVVLAGRPQELFGHLLLYGVAALCEDAGLRGLTVSWTAGQTPRPCVSAPDLDADLLGHIVSDHARARIGGDSWLQLGLPHDPARALLSARIKPPPDAVQWKALQDARHQALDTLTSKRSLVDLAFLSALGQPAYWRHRADGSITPDDGATRIEMQPRNQGSEFVGTRLRAVATAVAERAPEGVRNGLIGEREVDELAGAQGTSRSGVNLRPLGPTDAAQVWAALWGFSWLPLALKAHARARTAGHLPRERGGQAPVAGTFVTPAWQGGWRPARARSVLRSGQLAAIGASAAEQQSAPDQAVAWLWARAVRAVWLFPVETSGSTTAPERRALGGRLVRLASPS